jgi:hypothetical protein
MPMLNEHEDSFQKPIRVDNLGPVFIPCGDSVEGLLTVIKVRESALHVSARQYLGMVYGADPEQSASKANYAEH